MAMLTPKPVPSNIIAVWEKEEFGVTAALFSCLIA